MKHRSLYHVVQEQKELKAMMLKMFIKTFINLRSLINNDLKRKQKHSTNESHLLSMIITFENTILNHLVKKLKTNKLKSTSITSISISFSFEDFYKDIYQFEIIDKQWLEEKTETLNKWKSFA